MAPKSIPNSDEISGVAPLGTPVVAQTAFGYQKWAPNAPKVVAMIEKSIKDDTKEPPIAKKNSKNQVFSEPGLADCAKRSL